MKTWRLLTIGLGAVIGILGFAGYQAYRVMSARDAAREDLKEFIAAYVEHHDKIGKWPKSLEEMKTALSGKSASCQERARHDLVMAWGSPFGAKMPGSDMRVIAVFKTKYMGRVPTLYQDGTVKFLTEEEYDNSERMEILTPVPKQPKGGPS